ncbi:hypothetical protein LCGC14_1922220 [marine sediment metagenome]|uniref:Uncharacterized protein n=1 Tax=marine sediment metagenome TaxID=412755 RepID=A0A0F9IN57_9ZZZZ
MFYYYLQFWIKKDLYIIFLYKIKNIKEILQVAFILLLKNLDTEFLFGI